MEAELRADPKELAEHAMLVDLARNDVGRVAAPASVEVTTLRDVERFDGWLYRLLMRAINDEFRRRRRFQVAIEAIQSEPAVGDGASNLAQRDQLERGFRRLSVDHRAIVVLHHYIGLPLTEAATALGIPLGTAKSRYHHAMSALRSALEAEGRLGDREEVLV